MTKAERAVPDLSMANNGDPTRCQTCGKSFYEDAAPPMPTSEIPEEPEWVTNILRKVHPLSLQQAAVDYIDALLSVARGLEAHIGKDVSLERIKEAHSFFPPDAAQVPQHRAYHQGRDGSEACYICTLLALLQQAEQRCAELERDAQRYRWLREYKLDSLDNQPFQNKRREELDAAIDAAPAQRAEDKGTK